ncbi:MAG: hypothetical protein B1H13_04255 [Desulfobacteraceae bacterium 4484_190.3]|nr:MAG: hypothetical protein B1H13_04255 [Desulfobacteraceae bacterium 4484_190.3]
MSLLPDFEYRRPGTLKDAISLLSDYGEEAVLLAGGTALVPRLRLGLKRPNLVIDIKEMAEDLRYVKNEAGVLRVGCLSTIYEIKKNALIRDNYPSLHEAATLMASEDIQQRGTVGGNILQDTRCTYYNKSERWRKGFQSCFKMGGAICNAAKGGKKCLSVYSGDLAPALISLGASVCIMSSDGERELPLEDIFSGDGSAPFSLTGTDFLKEIILPIARKKGGYDKFRLRKSIDYPIANAAFSIDDEHHGRVVVGSSGPKPFIYDFSSPEELNKIPGRAYDDMRLINNMSFPPLYRKHLAKVLVERLIRRDIK